MSKSLPQLLVENGTLKNYMTVKEAITAIKNEMNVKRSQAYSILDALVKSHVIEVHPARISITKFGEVLASRRPGGPKQ